jgi:predicted nucleic acid-binding protein
MNDKYLLDTAIWIDFGEDRVGFNGEPLGEYAFKLLSEIKTRGSIIVVTDFLIKELEKKYSVAQINGLFRPFERLLQKVIPTGRQAEEARRISFERGVPKGDALFAIVARDSDLVLITRDKHFRLLEDISNHYTPEDLI